MNINLEVEVRGRLLIVTQPATEFFVIYAKSSDQPHLVLKRRSDTKDQTLLALAFQAAIAKARELRWVV